MELCGLAPPLAGLEKGTKQDGTNIRPKHTIDTSSQLGKKITMVSVILSNLVFSNDFKKNFICI